MAQTAGTVEIQMEARNHEIELEGEQIQRSQRMEGEGEEDRNQSVLRLLDSMDGYLTLYDSLSSTLRQGWFDLASARHSMGTSRISYAMLDLKEHSASTSLQIISDGDGSIVEDSTGKPPHLQLRKWGYLDKESCYSEDKRSKDHKESGTLKQRHRVNSQLHGICLLNQCNAFGLCL
ncbi:hypothetical protein LINPERPRIM_LOCUS32483 [Linum perenne]